MLANFFIILILKLAAKTVKEFQLKLLDIDQMNVRQIVGKKMKENFVSPPLKKAKYLREEVSVVSSVKSKSQKLKNSKSQK